jgi:site-specific recombinase XerC
MGSVFRQPGRRMWMLKYFRNGRPIYESSGTEDQRAATNLLKTREADIVRGVPLSSKVGRVRFDEAAQDIINDYRINGRRSLDELERRIRLHLAPYFGDCRLSAITTSDVRTFVTGRQAAGASAGEINRELAALKRMFSLALQAGKLLHKPHIPMLKERNVRSGFFELDQFLAVRAHLPAPLQPVVAFAYLTGWRIDAEILPLAWRQVDLAAGEVRLDSGTTKNDEGRLFKLTDELRVLLEAQARERDGLRRREGTLCPYVFHRSGQPIRRLRRRSKRPASRRAVPALFGMTSVARLSGTWFVPGCPSGSR